MTCDQFKELFLPMQAKLYRIIVALVNNREDAEDLLQEACIKLWDHREELERVDNAEAYCVTVVKHLSIDYLRNRQEHTEQIDVQIAIPDECSAEGTIEQRDTLQKVRQCIGELPSNQQQVIRLRVIADCSIEQTQQITGYSSENIRTLLSRARSSIKDKMRKRYGYGR